MPILKKKSGIRKWDARLLLFIDEQKTNIRDSATS